MDPLPTPAPVLVYRDILLALAAAPDYMLDLPVIMHIVVPEDTPAGSIMFLPAAGVVGLTERIYETALGLCSASQLDPEEFNAELPVLFDVGHPMLSNVADDEEEPHTGPSAVAAAEELPGHPQQTRSEWAEYHARSQFSEDMEKY